MSKEQTVTAYLNDPKFVEFLESKGLSKSDSVESIYPYTVEYSARTTPIANDGNLGV